MVFARTALLATFCCLLLGFVSSAKRRGLQQETIDRANAALLRENTHREALQPGDVLGEQFKVEISGVNADQTTVQLIEIDPIEIPPIEMGADENGQNLVFCPGYPIYGNITIQAVKGSEIAQQNRKWWETALQKGSEATADITVTLLDSKGEPARTWNLIDTWPVRVLTETNSFDYGDFNPETKLAVETIVCKIGHVELAQTGGTPPGDEAADFGITILGADDKSEEDTSWGECTGGALSLHAGTPPECPTAGLVLMPNTEVTQLELRGPVVGGRGALVDAMASALLADEDDEDLVKVDEMISVLSIQLESLRRARRERRERAHKRQVRVRASRLGDDSTFEYTDCFPTRYEFPKVGAAAGEGAAEEAVKFQALGLTQAA